jgi:hypothetical protein
MRFLPRYDQGKKCIGETSGQVVDGRDRRWLLFYLPEEIASEKRLYCLFAVPTVSSTFVPFTSRTFKGEIVRSLIGAVSQWQLTVYHLSASGYE